MTNQVCCQHIGGQLRAVARIEYHKPCEPVKRTPAMTFGKMACLQLGDSAPKLVGRIGGVSPAK